MFSSIKKKFKYFHLHINEVHVLLKEAYIKTFKNKFSQVYIMEKMIMPSVFSCSLNWVLDLFLSQVIFTINFGLRFLSKEIHLMSLKVAQSRPILCDSLNCSPPGSSVLGILQARILEWVGIPFSRRSSPPRDWTQVSYTAGMLYHPSHQGSPKINGIELNRSRVSWETIAVWNSPGQNTGVGSLSLLQGIFSTQGSNPGSPHCRQILYQLSHKGSPYRCV